MKKLFSILDEVERLLTKYPLLRDDDERLMANIWGNHLGPLDNISGRDIIRMLAKHKLPSHESISRCRRKIQQMNPKLRGEKWDIRHKRAKTIKKDISSYQCFGDETI